MRHLKRTIAFIAMLAMSIACVGPVYAANSVNKPEASPTLISYAVWLEPGTKSGELRVTFDVTAAGRADRLGVSYFEIHKASNGELVDTVYGTTSNGLVSSGFSYTYTYSYTGATPGVKYYAVVSVFAEILPDFDSRTLRTVSVEAP